jgi:NAD(P)-dependent dehydrogenase (short-subunit alcohol dehydrogenase family)
MSAMFESGMAAIVTGVGPGMGRSIALGFAREGVDVALAARRVERLEAVAREIRSLGREPLVMPLDITDGDGCRRLVAATAERFGGVDCLVQNGHDEGDWSPAHLADAERWRRVFEVNFFGALNLAQAAVPAMRARGGGAMVFVNSGAAIKAPPGMGAYAASKAALASLVRSMALELGPEKIRVNGVLLGATTGETLDKAAANAGPAQGVTPEEWIARKPAEFALRAIPTPEECAGSVLYLCSDLARPVTGHHVAVNGGQWIS